MEHIFLSRRNLLTLLSKLDRRLAGEVTNCEIIKNDRVHKTFPQSMDSIRVIAVDDVEYYTDRGPGVVHALDEAAIGGIG